MYQITCDEHIIYDPRDDELVVLNPKCKLKINTVGEASFTILPTHPHYGKFTPLKSIFEIKQDGETIFRGRMTGDKKDFSNRISVDLEGIMGILNDTIVPPFSFPEDFPEAGLWENDVEYFLNWVLNRHNERQVGFFHRLRIREGGVTVTPPDGALVFSTTEYMTTWEVIGKLMEVCGGFICIQYDTDANYVDYVTELSETNKQEISFGGNLLDLVNSNDAMTTYSAVLPLGGVPEGSEARLTIADLPDGDIDEDLVKSGEYVYSRSAVDAFDWICVSPSDATWDDVLDAEELKTRAAELLKGRSSTLAQTITIKGIDLAFTDELIESFRIYKNLKVNAPAHGVEGAIYPLTELTIDILKPQNTKIVAGDTGRSLIGIASTKISSTNTGAAKTAAAFSLERSANAPDSVVHHGKEDGWSFRRWNSGVFECWQVFYVMPEELDFPVALKDFPSIQITKTNGKINVFVIGEVEGSE